MHACGEASDLAMRACVNAGARFVVSPCCVGKLSAKSLDNYTFNATGANCSRISYPRSKAVAAVLDTAAYDSVACAGEFAEKDQLTGARGALRRVCKSWLEHDRQLWAEEQGYTCHVCRMVPEAASPKNHILCGWPSARPPPRDVAALLATEAVDGTLTDAAALLAPTGAPGADGAAGAAGAAGGARAVAEGAGAGAGAGAAAAAGAVEDAAAAEERVGAALAASEWEPEELAEVREPRTLSLVLTLTLTLRVGARRCVLSPNPHPNPNPNPNPNPDPNPNRTRTVTRTLTSFTPLP